MGWSVLFNAFSIHDQSIENTPYSRMCEWNEKRSMLHSNGYEHFDCPFNFFLSRWIPIANSVWTYGFLFAGWFLGYMCVLARFISFLLLGLLSNSRCRDFDQHLNSMRVSIMSAASLQTLNYFVLNCIEMRLASWNKLSSNTVTWLRADEKKPYDALVSNDRNKSSWFFR